MASRGVNKVILVGNVGQDPEVRYMPNGNAVANVTVATSESWKDAQGVQQDKTEWHRVVVFGKLAEIVGEYVRKGTQVYFEGKLETRKWKDQSGQDRYSTEVKVDSFTGVMQMLGGKQGESGQSGKPAPQQQRPAPQQQQHHQQSPQQRPPVQQQGNAAYQAPQQGYAPAPQQQGMQMPASDGWQDDIPFAPIGLQY